MGIDDTPTYVLSVAALKLEILSSSEQNTALNFKWLEENDPMMKNESYSRELLKEFAAYHEKKDGYGHRVDRLNGRQETFNISPQSLVGYKILVDLGSIMMATHGLEGVDFDPVDDETDLKMTGLALLSLKSCLPHYWSHAVVSAEGLKHIRRLINKLYAKVTRRRSQLSDRPATDRRSVALRLLCRLCVEISSLLGLKLKRD